MISAFGQLSLRVSNRAGPGVLKANAVNLALSTSSLAPSNTEEEKKKKSKRRHLQDASCVCESLICPICFVFTVFCHYYGMGDSHNEGTFAFDCSRQSKKSLKELYSAN